MVLPYHTPQIHQPPSFPFRHHNPQLPHPYLRTIALRPSNPPFGTLCRRRHLGPPLEDSSPLPWGTFSNASLQWLGFRHQSLGQCFCALEPNTAEAKDLNFTAIRGLRISGSVILVDFGFGFDMVSGDHKIVRLVLYADWERGDYWKHNFWTSEVKVYSLRTSSWRRVHDLPFNDLKLCTPSVHVNGALHWLVCVRDSGQSPRFVIAFDLANEKFQNYLVPNNLECGFFSCLSDLNDCLCLCLNDKAKAREEVWLMKEYGVHESWCRLFVFENCELPRKPLLLSKTCSKVLIEQDSKELFWYDYISEQIEMVNINSIPGAFKTAVCAGSLLLLDGNSVQAAQL